MIAEDLKLMKPDLFLKAAYSHYCDSLRAAKEPKQWLEDIAHKDFEAYLHRIKEIELGLHLPHGFVPCSMFVLVRKGTSIIGNSSLRHQLTPDLEDLGGHIGYRIHPAERGKGYGTIQLQLLLDEARKIGLEKVLVTCDTDNIASSRVIEHNGGLLASQGASRRTDKEVSRYWIAL